MLCLMGTWMNSEYSIVPDLSVSILSKSDRRFCSLDMLYMSLTSSDLQNSP